MRPITQIIVDDAQIFKQPPNDTEAAVPSPPPENKSGRKGNPPSSARLAKRPAAPSPAEPRRKISGSRPRALALSEIVKSGNSAGSDLVIREEPPWDTFKKYYECDLAGKVAVCV